MEEERSGENEIEFRKRTASFEIFKRNGERIDLSYVAYEKFRNVTDSNMQHKLLFGGWSVALQVLLRGVLGRRSSVVSTRGNEEIRADKISEKYIWVEFYLSSFVVDNYFLEQRIANYCLLFYRLAMSEIYIT